MKFEIPILLLENQNVYVYILHMMFNLFHPLFIHSYPFAYKIKKSCTSGPANHEIGGFMPAREEFEYEFDNDAETTVKEMVFDENDTPEDITLKTTILNIYNTALDRRIERKKFLKDRGITHDFRKLLSMEKRRPKDEKELYNRTRVFAKFQTAQDYETFMDGLLRM